MHNQEENSEENFTLVAEEIRTGRNLVDYLYHDGFLDKELAKKTMEEAKKQSLSVTQYLVKHVLSAETLLNYCTKKFSIPIYDLKKNPINWKKSALMSPELISRYRVIPLHLTLNTLTLGVSDPTDLMTFKIVSFHTGFRIRAMLISEDELEKIINTYFHSTPLFSHIATTLAKISPPSNQLSDFNNEFYEKNKNEAEDEPLIEFVNCLLKDAIVKRASDIHIEPYEQNSRIRFRLDGLLCETANIPQHLSERVITRLKIMANLNIAERRLPQDGRIQVYVDTLNVYPKNIKNKKIDIRINTCPTVFGEKIVLRLLNNKNTHLEIESLGLTVQQKNLFISKLTQPQGLILVTGPTGSGKTFTLYSALHFLNHKEKNISSVEDPVEIKLMGINQVNIHPKIGLNFATVLRTFLRQDPDVIMIGEIRDKETAEISIQAAQTGHLVLSTLHTNCAIEAITRLKSLGIDTHHILNSLSLIIAQRLIRKLCTHCKQLDKVEYLPGNLQGYKNTKLSISLNSSLKNKAYQANGCEQCHQGYSGRTGIFELIPITENFKQLILSGKSELEIAKWAKQEEIIFLSRAGLKKVDQGLTTINEIIRVLGDLSLE